ncbi:MAG: DUF2845 domain-containing protein [Syntrophobacteraceae bacterium]
MKRILSCLAFLFVAMNIFYTPDAWAAPSVSGPGVISENIDSLRCGDHLVQLGETQLQVVHQCGLPDVRDSYFVYTGTMDRWTYNMGPKDFIYVFTFLNGMLRNIRETDRGF